MSTRHSRISPPFHRRRRSVAAQSETVHSFSLNCGFTLPETLVVIGIFIVLVAILMPVYSRARRASQSVVCLSHLRALNSAFQHYSQANGDHLPYPALNGIPWERSLLRYTNDAMFICPGDAELAPMTNSSYDWRDTGILSTTMAGRAWGDCTRHDAVMVFDALPSWHVYNQMNVGLLDGSVRPMDQQECVNDLSTAVRNP